MSMRCWCVFFFLPHEYIETNYERRKQKSRGAENNMTLLLSLLNHTQQHSTRHATNNDRMVAPGRIPGKRQAKFLNVKILKHFGHFVWTEISSQFPAQVCWWRITKTKKTFKKHIKNIKKKQKKQTNIRIRTHTGTWNEMKCNARPHHPIDNACMPHWAAHVTML